ncbi:hypothetical protein quinque_014190 [Culex quinquefasciatus]
MARQTGCRIVRVVLGRNPGQRLLRQIRRGVLACLRDDRHLCLLGRFRHPMLHVGGQIPVQAGPEREDHFYDVQLLVLFEHLLQHDLKVSGPFLFPWFKRNSGLTAGNSRKQHTRTLRCPEVALLVSATKLALSSINVKETTLLTVRGDHRKRSFSLGLKHPNRQGVPFRRNYPRKVPRFEFVYSGDTGTGLIEGCPECSECPATDALFDPRQNASIRSGRKPPG